MLFRSSINTSSLKLLFTGKIKEFWIAINANFLISIFLGIIVSVLSLAKIITYLLDNHPVMVWSFFFGLVLASVWSVSKRIKQLSVSRFIIFAIGAIIAFFITKATPSQTPESLWFIFICGCIAICAMILPGISGSFILLLLGKYQFIMQAITEKNISVIAVFGAGACIGIISFSNVLSWLLKKHHDMTIATLAGFMLGSLNKVWPWKESVETFVDRHGVIKPLIERNILPDESVIPAIILALSGFVIVIIIEKVSEKGIKA